jgi:hypothetical protein
MWWFLKNAKTRAVETANDLRLQTEEQLLAQVPDLSGLDRQEIAIKIWLPELVARTLKWVADYDGLSQSSWVRDRLLGYVYGRVATLAHHIRAQRAAENQPMFSRAPVDRSAGRWIYKAPQLGKNTVAFKVWVSQQMRDDLEVLAKHAGVGLSPFVREAIVSDLLGRGSLPERPEIMGMTTDSAMAWERDEAVPTELIEEDAFNGLGEAERVWMEHQ